MCLYFQLLKFCHCIRKYESFIVVNHAIQDLMHQSTHILNGILFPWIVRLLEADIYPQIFLWLLCIKKRYFKLASTEARIISFRFLSMDAPFSKNILKHCWIDFYNQTIYICVCVYPYRHFLIWVQMQITYQELCMFTL